MATVREVRQYLGTLAAILWNYGATVPVPTLVAYSGGELAFSMVANLPGEPTPRPAEIRLAEIWREERPKELIRAEYSYDFVDYPLARRRAFHGHDPDHFRRAFGVLVHEHCEERLGAASCDHYFGLPIDGFEAIRRFTTIWSQPKSLGCSDLRCME